MEFFWSNPYKTELVITSLIEMLELTKLWSHDHIYNIIGLTKKKFLVTSWTEIMMSIYLISRKPRVAIFAEIFKIVTMFIKSLKTQKKSS